MSVQEKRVKGKFYLYFQKYQNGQRSEVYIGPSDDIRSWREARERYKASLEDRLRQFDDQIGTRFKRMSVPTDRRRRLHADLSGQETTQITDQGKALENEIRRRLVFDEGGFFDNTPLIFDPILLKMAVRYATFKLAGVRMTKIMTAAVDGITLATIMAGTFDVRIVIAKPTREVGVREYLEMSYIPGTTGIIRTLFAPRKSLTAADEVIIVDDVIESAETQIVLIEMAKRARADIAAVFGLVGIGTEWKHRIREVVDCPVFVGLELGAKPKAVIRP